ncbi:hypothetical protein [Haloterrigena alkaliphila]|uniref:hypothetical protein n=1 Tax=Haloterrigena alkaliphila TaxID=2816475 RepID=UPI001CFFC2E7|nr:hypothetical protein [Haloterrigena alkaliphila]UHQ95178.1 hypothetical protein J0X25_18930 [Haloterrigena alkaliphila]
MSNPFDDLKEDETETSEDETETPESTATTESEQDRNSEQPVDESTTAESSSSNPSGESTQEPMVDQNSPDELGVESSSPAAAEPPSPGETGPAFEYSEVQQKPFYARTETVRAFENQIRTTIIPKLAEASIIDEEKREIHDAVLRLATEQPERIAELVLEERRQSGNE